MKPWLLRQTLNTMRPSFGQASLRSQDSSPVHPSGHDQDDHLLRAEAAENEWRSWCVTAPSLGETDYRIVSEVSEKLEVISAQYVVGGM